MSEILSTIDLIMERTRGMSLSEEERESLHKEDLRKRAKGFRLRLLENPSETDEILASLNKESQEDRRLLEFLLWEVMVEGMPIDATILKHLDLMEKLPQAKNKGHALNRLRVLVKAGLKGKAADRKKILIRERKKLAALGISGSAVVPKIPRETDPDPEFVSDLEKFTKELLSGVAA